MTARTFQTDEELIAFVRANVTITMDANSWQSRGATVVTAKVWFLDTEIAEDDRVVSKSRRDLLG